MAATLVEDPSKYAGFTGIGYPKVFTTMPDQPNRRKPGQLTPEQVKNYFEDGFLVVENLFTQNELEPVKESYRRLISNIAQRLFDTGRIKNLYEDRGLEDRLIMLEKEWPGAFMLLLKVGKLTPEFRELYQNDKLLNVMEQLLGPEIAANPIWNTRPKLPQHDESDVPWHVPWHQDSAYFDGDSYSTLVATSWTAIEDVTENNGCLQFYKGGHKKGMVGVHQCCDNFYLMLQEEELINRFGANPETDFVKCPVKAGGVVFFSNMIPHRSVPNVTNKIRWGMDFRFQRPSDPWGFYGLKQGITLRSSADPNLKPDWDFFDSQDRFVMSKEYEIEKTGEGVVDEFDTTLTGPYMERWQVVKHNVHVDLLLEKKRKEEEEKNMKAKINS